MGGPLLEAGGFRDSSPTYVRTLAIALPGGFDPFVAEVGEPAPRPGLPAALAMPDLAVLLSAAANDGQEILGPPPGPAGR